MTAGVAVAGSGEGVVVNRPTTRPAWNVDECPAYVQEERPAWLEPHLGRFGLPEPHASRKEPIGVGTRGIDLWQANHFIAYNPQTAEYLYRQYSSPIVPEAKGLYPLLEKLVVRHTAGLRDPREKAVALLTRAMPEALLHPGIPPYSSRCPTDRGLDDEGLVATSKGYCNEQARVFVRLCQIAGVPARMIFLFYADKRGGHVIAEFYADRRWCMADSSWLCVFPTAAGRLMTAAECHQDTEHRHWAGRAYHRRNQELIRLSDEELVGGKVPKEGSMEDRRRIVAENAAEARKELGAQTAEQLGDQLWVFGVLNYPLPTRHSAPDRE